jgi:hypothetical protein
LKCYALKEFTLGVFSIRVVVAAAAAAAVLPYELSDANDRFL